MLKKIGGWLRQYRLIFTLVYWAVLEVSFLIVLRKFSVGLLLLNLVLAFGLSSLVNFSVERLFSEDQEPRN